MSNNINLVMLSQMIDHTNRDSDIMSKKTLMYQDETQTSGTDTQGCVI